MPLSAAIKRSFGAGLILITPLVVTLFVFQFLINWALLVVDPVVQGAQLTQYTLNDQLVAQVVASLLIVLAITMLGYLAQQSVGRHLFGNMGRIVNVVPLVNTIYANVRQVATSFVDRDTAYDSVVLVEYPREDIYSIGFVTSESPTAVEEFVGQATYNVFLPNSPNPTAGRLVVLPEDQVHEIDMSVRRGMRLVVTTGIGEQEESAGLPSLDGTPS